MSGFPQNLRGYSGRKNWLVNIDALSMDRGPIPNKTTKLQGRHNRYVLSRIC